VSPTDPEPRQLLREILAVQVAEGMKPCVPPHWADSDWLTLATVAELCNAAARELTNYRAASAEQASRFRPE
jgi:hypothetical protein